MTGSLMERREHPRFLVCVEIEIVEWESRIPSRGNTTDVGLGGCYVATIFPLPVGAKVDIQMRIADGAIKGRGSVQTCHHGVGMGIKFNDLTLDALHRLGSYLQNATSISLRESAAVWY
jgi:hypothetical protein